MDLTKHKPYFVTPKLAENGLLYLSMVEPFNRYRAALLHTDGYLEILPLSIVDYDRMSRLPRDQLEEELISRSVVWS